MIVRRVARGRYMHGCPVCGALRFLPDPVLHRRCGQRLAPVYRQRSGPGKTLATWLRRTGHKATKSCACRKYARVMNIWGPELCLAQLDVIVGWLRPAWRRLSVTEKAFTIASAARTGLVWKCLSPPWRPLESLVRAAIAVPSSPPPSAWQRLAKQARRWFRL